MTQTAIAAQVHQSLDRDTDFAAQVAFDDILADFGAQALDFGFGQITNLCGRGNACGFAELLRTGTADAVDALQPDPDVLLAGRLTPAIRAMTRFSN